MKSKKNLSVNWNINLLFDKNDPLFEKFEKENRIIADKLLKQWKSNRKYLIDPKTLKIALDEFESFYRNYGHYAKEWYYYYLKLQLDQNNPQLKSKFNKINELSTAMGNDLQFFKLNLAKVNLKTQKIFINSPILLEYRHFLETLFAESRYLLSEKEEKILSLKSTTSYNNWLRMTESFLSKETAKILVSPTKKEEKTFAEILSFINDKNKKVRDYSAKVFNQIILKHRDTAEAEINSLLLDKKTNDDLRKMYRPDLARHISDDIDSTTVDTLIETVSKRFDIPQKYYELKAKLFGVKKLDYQDRNAEYADISVKYTYEKGVEIVNKVLSQLDSKFSEIFMGFVLGGKIDVYPKKGKHGGAFCQYNLLTEPTYIMLNYTDKLQDVLTLAHETGHGINNELMKIQNSFNFGTPLSTAEVSSTFMEDFVLEEVSRNISEEERLSLMMAKLNEETSTIFRQVACYRFEQELHKEFRKKMFLSKEEIGAIFQKNMRLYMGKSVEQSPGSENWWIYWSHIRHYFYVYSYASGLLISKYLQKNVRKNPKFISKVKTFLSAGLSQSPKSIFEELGININDKKFWQEGLSEIETLLDQTCKLAEKLGKI